MSRALKIIQVAKSYLGIVEKSKNTGWYSESFQAKIVKAGWYMGAPWCAFFTKLIWREVYADNKAMLAIVNSCLNGSAKQSFDKAKANGTFKTGSDPKPGAIVIWLNGKGPSGHAGIVVSVDGNTMTTIEGNTNASGSREGDRVAQKLRTVSRAYKADGLNVYGYIYPFEQ